MPQKYYIKQYISKQVNLNNNSIKIKQLAPAYAHKAIIALCGFAHKSFSNFAIILFLFYI